MKEYSKKLEAELNSTACIPVFEIEVIDSDLASDWVHCDVYIQGNTIVAERNAVSSDEERSDFIAKSIIHIDFMFGLQDHLEWLYDKVLTDIAIGGLYTLRGEL